MLCKNPFVKAGEAYGCGQCLPCRINRRRVWTHRIMLESMQHTDNTFITLTYDNEHLPADGSLNPAHTRDFLKRLRFSIEPSRIRYFLCGEYGDSTQRPHYHAALFGYPSCHYIQSRYSKTRDRCCPSCDLIHRLWGHGHVYLGTLTPESSAYIAGYVAKGKSNEGPNNCFPPFARMSLRPGIGGDAMHEIASIHLQYAEDSIDVVTSLRHGTRLMPLGRYLTRRLRTLTGRDPATPPARLKEMSDALLDVRMAAEAVTSSPGFHRFRNLAIKSLLIERDKGKIQSIEARQRLYKRKTHL